MSTEEKPLDPTSRHPTPKLDSMDVHAFANDPLGISSDVSCGTTRYILTHQGHPLVVLVSLNDLKQLNP